MKNILLIGLGRFGRHIAMELSELGHEIMAVDVNEGRVDKVLPYVTNAQIGDSTNAEFLESLGIGNYDICFVTIGGSFQNSLETTSLLKELGAKMVISRAERDVQEKFLLRNGELDIRRKYDINILAIKNNGELSMAISPDTFFTGNISLLVIGEHKAIKKCFHI